LLASLYDTDQATKKGNYDMTNDILAAEFTSKTKRYPATLYINQIANGRRSNVVALTVTGKREARQLAEQYGATPWNF
jgi:hypothetical protein